MAVHAAFFFSILGFTCPYEVVIVTLTWEGENQMQYMGTTQAAKELGVSTARVRQLILAGRLKAAKVGWEWLILPRDLDRVRDRKPGRPWHRRKHHAKA